MIGAPRALDSAPAAHLMFSKHRHSIVRGSDGCLCCCSGVLDAFLFGPSPSPDVSGGSAPSPVLLPPTLCRLQRVAGDAPRSSTGWPSAVSSASSWLVSEAVARATAGWAAANHGRGGRRPPLPVAGAAGAAKLPSPPFALFVETPEGGTWVAVRHCAAHSLEGWLLVTIGQNTFATSSCQAAEGRRAALFGEAAATPRESAPGAGASSAREAEWALRGADVSRGDFGGAGSTASFTDFAGSLMRIYTGSAISVRVVRVNLTCALLHHARALSKICRW